jgi:hypothetical protein
VVLSTPDTRLAEVVARKVQRTATFSTLEEAIAQHDQNFVFRRATFGL